MTQLKEIQQRLKDSKENATLLTADTEGVFCNNAMAQFSQKY